MLEVLQVGLVLCCLGCVGNGSFTFQYVVQNIGDTSVVEETIRRKL